MCATSNSTILISMGNKIRSLRLEREMTIPELSRLANVAVGTIGDIERGRIVNPGFLTIQKICKILQVDINYLLDSEIVSPQFSKILPLLKQEHLQLLQDEKFQDYFNVAQKAFNGNINPDVLDKMLDLLLKK